MIIVSRVVSRGISTVRRRGQIEAKSHHHDEEPFYGKPRAKASGTSTPTTTIGNRIAIAIHNATTAYSDPTRADAVAVLGEITGPITLQRIHQKMITDPIGCQILKDRPIVSKATIPEYEQLILNAHNYNDTIKNHDDDTLTFGQAYGSFLKIHGFDPDERDDVNYIEDETLAYIMLRYRQCHDYFHTITGLPPTVLGELGLKWFEFFQTGLPIAALSCTVGSLRLNQEEQQILQNIYLPWAMKMNSQQQDLSSSSSLSSPFLMNIYYEKEFDTPIKELRNRLNLVPAPSIISSSNINST
ncbi:coenzyme q biosynthesis protein [Fragilariopsis cylindrus CCMP1102]|uniref:Ubiquinone biosynthesis protein COQ4 homolog, mitochondrial n=1 Tax=Fragilariopsis cylindrus CCMP1102 TaxID=635003 RepID=A0A1E7FKQ7_9STRA|nr:coenzyme q biosynthesis protein [Fragilariopsis cylindrus CCMP1102]|eukprot:OEU18759.1 coenzyme q biosynthesis protein [Fragilariopsis cylindrus CCMP1102]